MSETTDRRIRKTESSIRQALADLMTQKELGKITVKEIVELADINRATFYTHYHDVFELYESIEDGFLNDIREILSASYEGEDYSKLYKSIALYTYEHRDVKEICMGKNSPASSILRLNELLISNYTDYLQSTRKETRISEEDKYKLQYHIQGILGMFRYWVISDYSMSPREMAKMISDVDDIFFKEITI